MAFFESTDGVTCHVQHLGGSGPRVLFVHATGFCGPVWRPFAAELADRFECWALDVRSHGHSTDQADGSFRWEQTAWDVLGAIEVIESEHGTSSDGWRGVGHSMGGASLLFAEQARPGAFRSLWVFEPIVFPSHLRSPDDDARPNPLAEGAKRRRAVFESRAVALENFSSKPPMNTFHPDALTGYVEGGFVDAPDVGPDAVRVACDPAIEAHIYRTGGRHLAFDGLSVVRCPTAVVGGNADLPGPGMLAPIIAAALPAGRFVDRTDLGHFAPLEVPGDLARSAGDFFDGAAC